MEHEEATRIQAAERYLLGELSEAERDRFENHFFDCPACAEDVRAGAIFEANARAVLAEQPRRAPVPGWLDWLRLRPAFAASLAGLVVVLSGISTYEALVVVPGLRAELAQVAAPQSYPSFFLRSISRGDEQVIEVPGDSRFFGLSVDLALEHGFPRFQGEVLSESGASRFFVLLPAPRRPIASMNLLIPASSLELGRRYTLVLRGLEEGSTGKPGIEIARYHFLTQRK